MFDVFKVFRMLVIAAAVIGGVTTLSASIASLLLFVVGLVYLASAVILLFVPAVRAHFRVGNAKA